MKDFSTERPTEPGTYWYKRPLWRKPTSVQVEVVPGDDELYVRFHNDLSPHKMSDIPADALWTPAVIALSELKEEVQKLLALLEDPQDGLMTWHGFLKERSDNISKLMGMPIDMSK